MGGTESKNIPMNTDFFVKDHGDKYANLGYISLGLLLAWLVIGIALAIYVYSQISPNEPKMRSSHSW